MVFCGRRRLAAAALLFAVAGPLHAQTDKTARQKFQERQVERGLPDILPAHGLDALPVTTTTLADGLGWRVVPADYLPTRVDEPQHGWAFARLTYVYVPQAATDEKSLLCRVHYDRASDAPLAGRIGGLLALAHRTLVAQTGREGANGTRPFDVWLCRAGLSGGEQWRDNLYFYDPDQPRSSIEWVREIVHEYSHLALAPIGGYAAPEYWANGYYGERLITRWIARAPQGPKAVAAVWGEFGGYPNFDRLLIAPALSLYKKVGPSPAWAAKTNDEGMRYLIGQILTADDKYGGRTLAEAFANLPLAREAHGADFGEALAAALASRTAQSP